MAEVKDEFAGAQEVASNWFKFKVVGDAIKGTLINKRFQKSTTAYPDQWVYEIKTADGQVWNVGISVNKVGTIARLNKCQLGEIIGIKFDSEGKSAITGGAKAHNLKVFTFGMDANFSLESDDEIDIDDIKLA